MKEAYIGDPGDEHVESVLPLVDPRKWYRDDEGYFWPSPGKGRILVEESDSDD
jgi:hypothetical protein